MTEMPQAWADLLEGLTLLAKHQSNEDSPFHCSNDTLTVMAYPGRFTTAELDRLAGLGFLPDAHEDTFTSFRFGSA